MKTFKVKSWSPSLVAHFCDVIDVEKTDSYHVDLMVDGGFPEDTDPQSLVGKTFTGEDHVYTAIALYVKEVQS